MSPGKSAFAGSVKLVWSLGIVNFFCYWIFCFNYVNSTHWFCFCTEYPWRRVRLQVLVMHLPRQCIHACLTTLWSLSIKPSHLLPQTITLESWTLLALVRLVTKGVSFRIKLNINMCVWGRKTEILLQAAFIWQYIKIVTDFMCVKVYGCVCNCAYVDVYIIERECRLFIWASLSLFRIFPSEQFWAVLHQLLQWETAAVLQWAYSQRGD